MVRTISIDELRKRTDELLAEARDGEDALIVADDGELRAALIGPREYEQFERLRRQSWERGWQAIHDIQAANADTDPDEVYREVTAIVEEVRQELYERRQRKA